MNNNSENPRVGKHFQQRTLRLASELLNIKFEEEIPVLVGNPGKEHKFDVVSGNRTVVIECKCYTWTAGNNVPSAKMSVLNEAALYLQSLPDGTRKILTMKKDVRSSNGETLARYYCRTYGHLLYDIEVWENSDDDAISIVRKGD